LKRGKDRMGIVNELKGGFYNFCCGRTGRGLNPALKGLILLIRSVISFDPNPSLFVVSWDLAIFIMSWRPISPAIIISRNPNSFPRSGNPFTSHFPMARNIFLPRWTIMMFRCWGDNHRGRGQSGEQSS
jgi:hypothetical protein